MPIYPSSVRCFLETAAMPAFKPPAAHASLTFRDLLAEAVSGELLGIEGSDPGCVEGGDRSCVSYTRRVSASWAINSIASS